MENLVKIFLAALVAVLLAGCSSGGTTATAPPPAAASSSEKPWRPDDKVDWENYAPTVKKKIDRAGKHENCSKLQDAFDNADKADTVQRNRTGDGNADLMDYIDQWLQHAGCY